MNAKIKPHYDWAKTQLDAGKLDLDVFNGFKNEGGSFAVAVKVFEKLGFDLDYVSNLIPKSDWGNEKRNIQDLFIDFIELED